MFWSEIPVAEMSRPKRQIQQWLMEYKWQKVTYDLPQISHPSKQTVHKLAVTTNWFQPMVWTIINEAATMVGWQMSPTEIVKCCQGRCQQLFLWLRADVVGKWIDRSGSQPCWSAHMLARVAKENFPGGSITRKGVLVSGLLGTHIHQNSQVT